MSADQKLTQHAEDIKSTVTLKQLLNDPQHCADRLLELPGFTLDYSRQLITPQTIELLIELAKEKGLDDKITDMITAKRINTTENRPVLHVALRAGVNPCEDVRPSDKYPRFITEVDSTRSCSATPADQFQLDGNDIMPDITQVLDQVYEFSERVRNGEFKGATGETLTNTLVIGIGGSYLGTKFVYEALRNDNVFGANAAASGRTLRFLANVDPIDVWKALEGLDPHKTLVIVMSKTFTTSETMLNALTVKKWLIDALGDDAIKHHMVACSTAIDKVLAFGIARENIFQFWDYVGGRYSVTSSIGILPLSIQFGQSHAKLFLAGARDGDRHFFTAPLAKNVPVLLGLIGLWNSQYLGHNCRSIACYSEALCDFASHIQQVDMESNGKRVTKDGKVIQHTTGEVSFGVPGTNAQHSYFQLFHQGQVVPLDFIGSIHSQHDINHTTSSSSSSLHYPVTNHDELMCNFFAQPDALALGIDETTLREQGVAEKLIPHKLMAGNRPSSILLFDYLSAYEIGLLLSFYEHRTAVEGFLWDLNSFDQFGVELGKVLSNNVRKFLINAKQSDDSSESSSQTKQAFVGTTNALLAKYLQKRQ